MASSNLQTHFLPPERVPLNIIKKSNADILSFEHLNEILNSISSLMLIINEKRQIVFANNKILETIGKENIDHILGFRPGEMLSCIYSDKYPCGCGTSEECAVCGAAQAIKKCIEKKTATETECRIITKKDDTLSAWDLRITASPLKVKSSFYVVLSFIDISDHKRREWLEGIFYHDIINIAGSVSNIIELIDSASDAQKQKKYIKMAAVATKNLINEIISQRSITAAENGDLELFYEKAGSLDLINEVVSLFMGSHIAKNIKINITNESNNISFMTDMSLIKRILINLVKNALEASKDGETVTLSCTRIDDQIEFRISNPAFIQEDVQMQIFQRSFSTKGRSRGLGTYSVKLLTERYLNGSVGFTSHEKKGTTFTLRYPMNVNPVSK